MGKKLAEKVEFEVEEFLNESSARGHDGEIIGPKFYVMIHFPLVISKRLGEEAVDSGYKPGEKIGYEIAIKRIDNPSS